MANTSNQIPAATARVLRALTHDLSNALETIVQATYLISQAELQKDSRRWIEMIDEASKNAVTINLKLREILGSQN